MQTLLKVSKLRLGFPWDCGKESACQCRLEFSPWVGRSSGEGNGNPLQYSCLENPRDRETWQATNWGIAKSQMWLNVHTFQSGTWSLVPVGNRKMNRRHHGHLFNQNRGYKARNGLGGFESQTEGICVIKPRMGRRTVLYKWLPLLHPAVQFSSVAQSCPTLCDPMDCSMPGFPVHHQLPEFTQTHVHPVGDAIQPSHPLSSPSPAFNLSQYRVFSIESVCIRWPKYWSFSFSINPSNEYLGLISFRIDWLDLLAVQGTLKSLLQHHSSKA